MRKRSFALFLAIVFITSSLSCVSVLPSTNAQLVKASQVIKASQVVPAPDLEVLSEDILFSPESPMEGDVVTITVTIRNIGQKSSYDVEVGFYLGDPDSGGVEIGTDTISRVKARKSEEASIEWVSREGTHDIYVKADPDGQISEVDEENNEAFKTITVTPSVPPTPVHDVAVLSVAPSRTEVVVGDVVTITVVVENQGTETETFDVTTYYESTSIDTKTVISLAASTQETLTFSWDTTGVTEGAYTIRAEASPVAGESDVENNVLIDGAVTVLSEPPPVVAKYELIIEIDYMAGHEPTQEVFDHIEAYYIQREISVTFYSDRYEAGDLMYNDTNSDLVPYDPSVTNAEFWAIEAEFNDVSVYDDTAQGDSGQGVYTSQEKWVLFGTTVDGQPNVVGYCYVVTQRVGPVNYDLLAGNYIFIADKTADAWASSKSIEEYGAEATVLMHELGHSIGIAILDRRGREVYCGDSYCVMSTLNVNNAENYGNWRYCDDHWATRNMEYYTI